MVPSPAGAIVSFPKSGRTWYRLMVAQYLSWTVGGPDLDMGTMFAWLPNAEASPTKGYESLWANGSPSPTRVVASHDGTWLDRVSRSVLILRDPAEVLVSLFHHERKHLAARRFDGDFDEFLAWAGGLERLVGFLVDVSSHRHGADALVLTYDGLLDDAAAGLRSGLTHLGVADIDGDLTRRVVDACRFDRMAELERTGGFPLVTGASEDRDARRVRAGVLDRGVTLFDDRRRHVVTSAIEAALRADDLAWLRGFGAPDWTW